MKDDPMDALDQLLDDYFEDRLNETDRAKLERAILSSAAARERFWRRAGVEQTLESWGRRKRGELSAFEVTDSTPRTARPRHRWPMLAGWAAAAAVLAAWVIESRPDAPATIPRHLSETEGVTAAPSPAGREAPVAFLSRVEALRGEDRYHQGQSLVADREVRLEEGLMEVDFYSGARVTFQGPARFVPESDMQVVVLEGSAQADVPESAIGFRMVLPDGVVTDFGTRFGVEVRRGKTSQVQVSEGEVELAVNGSGQRSRLRDGQAVALGPTGEVLPIGFQPMGILRSLEELTGRKALLQRERWEQHVRKIDGDQNVLVHFRLLEEERGTREIRNHATAASAPGGGTVIAAEWSEGRWPGKPALGFRRPADRVRVDIPGEYPQASFVAWVRVDGLPRRYNGLFLSEYGIDGEVHWQFSSDGRFLFGVRPEGSSRVSKFHRAFSEPAIAPADFGSWRLLATTYDAERREVVHYVDGAEIARIEIEASVPLRFGRATMGNFFDPYPVEHAEEEGLGEEWSFRNWTGAIDEFLLFSRVLEPGEIAAIHEAGRPD